MTEPQIPTSLGAHPESLAELRHILEMVRQAEKILLAATNRLEAAAQPVTPPHPTPPPPWRELLSQLKRELDATAMTVLRAERITTTLTQFASGDKLGAERTT